MVQGIYTQNMAKNMVQYLHFGILQYLQFPLIRATRSGDASVGRQWIDCPDPRRRKNKQVQPEILFGYLRPLAYLKFMEYRDMYSWRLFLYVLITQNLFFQLDSTRTHFTFLSKNVFFQSSYDLVQNLGSDSAFNPSHRSNGLTINEPSQPSPAVSSLAVQTTTVLRQAAKKSSPRDLGGCSTLNDSCKAWPFKLEFVTSSEMKSSKFECASPYFEHDEPNKTCAPFRQCFLSQGKRQLASYFSTFLDNGSWRPILRAIWNHKSLAFGWQSHLVNGCYILLVGILVCVYYIYRHIYIYVYIDTYSYTHHGGTPSSSQTRPC